MTLYTHAGALPRHHYVFVEPNALGEHDWLAGVWFGISSYPGRLWACHVLLECGAIYRNVPLHQLATRETDALWTPAQAATWDCYSDEFSTIEYPYLAGLDAVVRTQDRAEHDGKYLFTAIPIGDGFSAAPQQSKDFFFIALDNGRVTAQPTNNVLIEDRSFTQPLKDLSWPTYLRRQTRTWSCEEEA